MTATWWSSINIELFVIFYLDIKNISSATEMSSPNLCLYLGKVALIWIIWTVASLFFFDWFMGLLLDLIKRNKNFNWLVKLMVHGKLMAKLIINYGKIQFTMVNCFPL